MSTLAVILTVVAVVLIILFAGGLLATIRQRRRDEERLRAELEAANEALALAHAQDKGWDRETMERAARMAFTARHPDIPIEELHLVVVVDRPGTDEDEAVFRVVAGGRQETVRLGRRDGQWFAAA